MQEVGLLGYEQAQAIAWSMKAMDVGLLHDCKLEIRIVPYRFTYQIKAWEIKEEVPVVDFEADKAKSPQNLES